MPIRYLDPDKYREGHVARADANADWEGNNAAFTCPVCSKVFIATAFNDPDGKIGRKCYGCGKSRAHCSGSAARDGKAWIEWSFDEPS